MQKSPPDRWLEAWSAVFAANLIVPLLFAWELTRGGGRIGMGCAIAWLWLAGAFGLRHPRCPRFALLVGGWAVALSQTTPLLQMVCGAFALSCWHGGMHDKPLSEVGGFAVTALTGGLLLMAALLIGGILEVLSWSVTRTADGSRRP